MSPFFYLSFFSSFPTYLVNAMREKSSKNNLAALKDLVEKLSDRDVKVKRDVFLFEEFFSNFPIPVTIWAVSGEGTVVSQRGNGLVRKNAARIETLFSSESNKPECIEIHKKALQGESTQKLIHQNEKVFFVVVVPRRDDLGGISGAAGLAWDVTPNYTMIKLLQSIEEASESILQDSPSHEKNIRSILSMTKNALECSRLLDLIKSRDEESSND